MESQEHIFMINSGVERTRGNRAINAAEDENYGEILKSGDNTLLRYKLFDGDGEILPLEGLPCKAVIKKDDIVVYRTPAEVDAENIVSFKITEVLPSDRNDPYTIEFIITQDQDTLIFPSDDRINLYIYPSSLSVDGDIIKQTPEDRLNEIVIVAVNDATQDFYSEVDEFRDAYNELIDTGVMQENINQKLAESEAEYAPRLTQLEQNDADLTAQLAQTRTFEDYEIQNKTRKTEALFTFWDDDSTAEVWTVLRPIQQEFNIPMTSAVLTSWVRDRSMALSIEQLQQLHDEGWAMTVHAQSHVNLSTLSLEEQEAQIKGALDDLKEWGIEDVTSIAYPFSGHNNNTMFAGRKYLRAGRTTDYGINRPPFQTWDLALINGEGKEHTLESLKKDVDDISENGGWGIYITHANLMNELDISTLRSIIQYIQSKGNIEIVTPNEALNRMGNLIDVGRYLERDKTIPHHVVGADGSTSSNTTPNTLMHLPNHSVDVDMQPSEFEVGKISVVLTNVTNRFPELGFLVTNNIRKDYAHQELTDYRNRKMVRYEVTREDKWGDWFEENTVIGLPTNFADFNTPITDFPNNKVSYCYVTDTTGFPTTGKTGELMTSRLTNRGYQEFTDLNGGRFYRVCESGGWTAPRRINSVYSGTNYAIKKYLNFENYEVGQQIFNTTANRPLFVNSTKDGFVDGMGNPVSL